MKPFKVFIVAAAAIAALVLIGASSASAETLYIALCKEDVLVCPEAKIIKHTHAVATGVKLLTSITTVTCEGLFLGDVLNGSPIGLSHLSLIVSGTFTYSSCKDSNGGGCTLTQLGPGGNVVMKTADEEAEVTTEEEVLLKCGSSHCVYFGGSMIGAAFGALRVVPTGEEVRLEEAVMGKVSGFLCSAIAKLDALYKPLEPTYIKS